MSMCMYRNILMSLARCTLCMYYMYLYRYMCLYSIAYFRDTHITCVCSCHVYTVGPVLNAWFNDCVLGILPTLQIYRLRALLQPRIVRCY